MAFPFLEKMVSYSYVRRWYFDPKTNQDIYLEYESYVTDCTDMPRFPFSGMHEETSCILSKIVVSWITISELFREGGLWNKICCRAEGRG